MKDLVLFITSWILRSLILVMATWCPSISIFLISFIEPVSHTFLLCLLLLSFITDSHLLMVNCCLIALLSSTCRCSCLFAITRPAITHIVHVLSHFVSAPYSTHYAALLRVLHYLRGTITWSLFFSATSSLELHAYFDGNWVSDSNDRWSTTGVCIFLGDSLISWKNKK